MTERRILAVLVVDMKGSTAILGKMSEGERQRLLGDLQRELLAAVTDLSGRVTNLAGDGLTATFASVASALDAGFAMQRSVRRINEKGRHRDAIRIRVGVAVSDVEIIDDVPYGWALTEAARLEQAAPPGEVYCTDAVRAFAGRGTNHEFERVADVQAKSDESPIPTFRVVQAVGDLVGLPGHLERDADVGFVGRQAMVDQLDHLWDKVTNGEGQLVVVEGPPGIGKTRLCTEFSRRARAGGALVLAGYFDEHGGAAYQPFVQAITHYLERVPPDDPALDAFASELARIVPGISADPDVSSAASSGDADVDRDRLFDAVAGWFSVLSERTPVLIQIDDLSWADESSIRMLQHLQNATMVKRVMVVTSYRRTEHAEHPDRFLARATGAHWLTRLDVGGLDDGAVVTFGTSLLGGSLERSAQRLVSAIGERFGGNPLYVREMLRSLTSTGRLERRADGSWTATDAADARETDLPARVAGLIRDRVLVLDDSARHVLEVAAVIGRRFSQELLIEVVPRPPSEVINALDEVVRADLIHHESDSSQYAFAHAVIRDSVYDGIEAQRRSAEHHRVGEAIARVHQDDLAPWLETLAYQFERGVDDRDTKKAVAFLCAAATQATRRIAHDQAVAFLERAHRLLFGAATPPDPSDELDLLLQLGTARKRSGRDEAGQTLRRATELALRMKDAPRAARAVLRSGRGIFSYAGKVDDERVELLRRTLDLIGPVESTVRAQLLAHLSAELTFADDRDAPIAVSDEALAIARELDNVPTLVTVISARLTALWRPDHVDERLRLGAEVDAIRDTVDDRWSGTFIPAMSMYCQAASEVGDFERADRILEWLERTAVELRQPNTLGYVKLRLANRACLAGDFERSESLAREAFDFARAAGSPDARTFWVGQRIAIRFQQGRCAEIADEVEQEITRNPGIKAFAAIRALIAVETDDIDRCRQVVSDLVAQVDEIRFDLNWLTDVWSLSIGCEAVEDLAAARILRERLRPYRHLFVDNFSTSFGSVHHPFAALSSVLGDHDVATREFAVALVEHERIRAPGLLALTQLAAARAELRKPEPDLAHARELLERARTSADERELMGVLRHADDTLATLGHPRGAG